MSSARGRGTVRFLNTTTYVSLLSVDCAWFLYPNYIICSLPEQTQKLLEDSHAHWARVLYNSSKRTLGSPRGFTGPKRKTWMNEWTNEWMNEWMSGSWHNEGTNHALFLAERPRREKLSHRPPRTIVDAFSKFELHRCLLRCVRECTGVGDVGPKLGTHVPGLDAREYFILLISRAIFA